MCLACTFHVYLVVTAVLSRYWFSFFLDEEWASSVTLRLARATQLLHDRAEVAPVFSDSKATRLPFHLPQKRSRPAGLIHGCTLYPPGKLLRSTHVWTPPRPNQMPVRMLELKRLFRSFLLSFSPPHFDILALGKPRPQIT